MGYNFFLDTPQMSIRSTYYSSLTPLEKESIKSTHPLLGRSSILCICCVINESIDAFYYVGAKVSDDVSTASTWKHFFFWFLFWSRGYTCDIMTSLFKIYIFCRARKSLDGRTPVIFIGFSLHQHYRCWDFDTMLPPVSCDNVGCKFQNQKFIARTVCW